MIYFSSLLKTTPEYKPEAEGLCAALAAAGIDFSFLENTKDIWLRDFMPVRTKSGKYISFRYEPSYLKEEPDLKTDFRDIADRLPISVTYSDINLDGGNVVFSPGREKAIISERVFAENPERAKEELVSELANLLEAKVILIPALKSDMTGHADGMVRFVDENTVIGNDTGTKTGHESKIKKALKKEKITVIDFPYFDSKGISAEGCYLNFLETKKHLFLPVFGAKQDEDAQQCAENIFNKKIIAVRCNGISEKGGVLNCVSWETI